MMKVSVITVCLNSEELEKTINSVLYQTFKCYEHLIIDGGSDSLITLNTLNKFKDTPGIKIVCEKDNGIYDAMNKGINLASGDYLIFLNAGDTFYDDKSIEFFLNHHNNCEIVYGNLEVKDETSYIKRYPSKLCFSYFLKDTLPHPACFIKKTLFSKFGLYETNMLISSDWAFFIKTICLHNATYMHLSQTISSFSNNGISSLTHNQGLIAEEKRIFLNNNFSLFIDDYSEMEEIEKKYARFKNSRTRRVLSVLFKRLYI